MDYLGAIDCFNLDEEWGISDKQQIEASGGKGLPEDLETSAGMVAGVSTMKMSAAFPFSKFVLLCVGRSLRGTKNVVI